MSVEEKLGVNKFAVDEEHAHIVVEINFPDLKAKKMLVNACPAGLYKLQEDLTLSFDYAGCLECGTCRVLGLGNAVKAWNYPENTMGIEFRYG